MFQGHFSRTFVPIFAQDEVANVLKDSLGVSTMRLQPKTSGVRPIVNMGSRNVPLPGGQKTGSYSVNAKLKQTFSILQFEVLKSTIDLFNLVCVKFCKFFTAT